jgi:hypothetical protein
MKIRSGVMWLVAVLSISRLAAQDVIATDPAWFEQQGVTGFKQQIASSPISARSVFGVGLTLR